MKIVLLLAVLVGGDNAAGTSDLPDCPTEGIKDNCVGTWTDSNGVTYIGELKSGVPNGRGTSNVMGDTYVGEWKGGHWNGQGTFTSADGGKYVGDFKMAFRADKAPTLGQMAPSTLVSLRIASPTDKAPTPTQMALRTLVSLRTVTSMDKAPTRPQIAR